jgi:hypothetical protein
VFYPADKSNTITKGGNSPYPTPTKRKGNVKKQPQTQQKGNLFNNSPTVEQQERVNVPEPEPEVVNESITGIGDNLTAEQQLQVARLKQQIELLNRMTWENKGSQALKAKLKLAEKIELLNRLGFGVYYNSNDETKIEFEKKRL